MINKIASTIEMSFDIPESEQKEAQLASELFSQVINSLDHAKDHLNIIYEPFKKASDVPPEAVWEWRGAIRQYKDQIKTNYNKVKRLAFQALVKLDVFSSDTHIMELINSFKDAIGELEKQIGILLDILDDLKAIDFRQNVISGIEAVRHQSQEIENLIKDRIIDHIDANILTRDWMANISNDLKVKVRERVPYITQLFQERQNAFNQMDQ